ncbi:MAG TPA: glycosyltransferase family 4 protein [bacterium]|nr:glycosyltransferase family 4 protein [bacterium]
MRTLSILQVNTAAGFGGGERVFADLCSALASRGHRVGAVVRKRGELAGVLNEAGVEIVMARKYCGPCLLSARRLGRTIGAGGWELINAHTPPDYMFAALVKRLSRSKPKLVFTRHILLPLGASPLHKWILGSADAIIAVSDAVKRVLLQHRFVDPGKVRAILNGIDADKFAPRGSRSLRSSLNVGKDERLVGILGEVSPHKGQELFVKAALLLLKQGYEATFVVAGPTKHKNVPYRGHLRSMVESSGYSGQISLVDRVLDMPDAMRSLDVMVLASEAEPFGLVTVEAMACGCAVVATGSGASCEIVTDGRDGLLVEPGSPEGIADAVRALLDDDEMRTRLARGARETAVNRFALHRSVDEVERLYLALCNRG